LLPVLMDGEDLSAEGVRLRDLALSASDRSETAKTDEDGETETYCRTQSTIHPSLSWMTRLPKAAFASECVTWMIVVPPSFSFLNSSMISRP